MAMFDIQDEITPDGYNEDAMGAHGAQVFTYASSALDGDLTGYGHEYGGSKIQGAPILPDYGDDIEVDEAGFRVIMAAHHSLAAQIAAYRKDPMYLDENEARGRVSGPYLLLRNGVWLDDAKQPVKLSACVYVVYRGRNLFVKLDGIIVKFKADGGYRLVAIPEPWLQAVTPAIKRLTSDGLWVKHHARVYREVCMYLMSTKPISY